MIATHLFTSTRRTLLRLTGIAAIAMAFNGLGSGAALAAKPVSSAKLSSTSLATSTTSAPGSTDLSPTSLAAPTTDALSSTKVAADLMAVVTASGTPRLSWAKDVNGVRYVKAVVVGAPSADPAAAPPPASVASSAK